MKTKKTTKDNHVGLRLDDDSLAILDGLCEAVGGASRSRVLRRLLLAVRPDPSDRYVGYDGKPIEQNATRRRFIEKFRRADDALVQSMVEGIGEALRRR